VKRNVEEEEVDKGNVSLLESTGVRYLLMVDGTS
jgi:hypothetical protein